MLSTVTTTMNTSAINRWLCSELAMCQPMPLSAGINAIGKVTATAVIVRIPAKRYVQPVNQACVFPARYFDHWYTESAIGMWLATSANDSAMMNCPAATIGQLQKKTPPMVERPRPKRAKMPVDGEM